MNLLCFLMILVKFWLVEKFTVIRFSPLYIIAWVLLLAACFWVIVTLVCWYTGYCLSMLIRSRTTASSQSWWAFCWFWIQEPIGSLQETDPMKKHLTSLFIIILALFKISSSTNSPVWVYPAACFWWYLDWFLFGYNLGSGYSCHASLLHLMELLQRENSC